MLQPRPATEIWRLVGRQHGAVSRQQLLAAGLSGSAIKNRVARGRLHPRGTGVYAVGRPDLSRKGQMMAALLACGPGSWISHETGAELWVMRRPVPGLLEVSIPALALRRRPGIHVHRRERSDEQTVTLLDGIPVATVPSLMIDMALRWPRRHLEAAVNQADALDLLNPVAMRRALDAYTGQPGVRIVRDLLDATDFRLTDSELERRFLRLVRRTGLPVPQTQRYLSSHRVDFLWPELGLVVETDSLRYHRTALQQRRDRERDHAHLGAGLLPLRFTHYQVRWQPQHVLQGLADGVRMVRTAR